MAERRMFAKSVIGSARFLRMPSSSRLLYYDLSITDTQKILMPLSGRRGRNTQRHGANSRRLKMPEGRASSTREKWWFRQITLICSEILALELLASRIRLLENRRRHSQVEQAQIPPSISPSNPYLTGRSLERRPTSTSGIRLELMEGNTKTKQSRGELPTPGGSPFLL